MFEYFQLVYFPIINFPILKQFIVQLFNFPKSFPAGDSRDKFQVVKGSTVQLFNIIYSVFNI